MFRHRISLIVGAATIAAIGVSVFVVNTEAHPQNLIAHEWGTFTSIAGENGQAVDWLPLAGPADLPCFVERTPDTPSKAILTARLRMETPVIYFYAPGPTTVDVNVQFAQGLVTEHFPGARVDSRSVLQSGLGTRGRMGTASWSNVRIDPRGDQRFPTEPGENHYYAARQTEAAPLIVNGQREKFLFYRGVSGFALPIEAVVEKSNDEDELGITIDTGGHTIHGAVLFENRGGRIGYQVIDRLTNGTALGLPSLDRSTSDLGTLRSELVDMLISAGLYPKEAAAMVETWRDSWFEEGVRLFYVIPQETVDAVLPLNIRPRPAELVRVFVGRLELATPSILNDIRDSVRRYDLPALEKYGRFLVPFGNRLLANVTASSDRSAIKSVLESASTSYNAASSSCESR